MDVAYLSALAALAGSVVGGCTTGLSTWTSERAPRGADARIPNPTPVHPAMLNTMMPSQIQ